MFAQPTKSQNLNKFHPLKYDLSTCDVTKNYPSVMFDIYSYKLHTTHYCQCQWNIKTVLMNYAKEWILSNCQDDKCVRFSRVTCCR